MCDELIAAHGKLLPNLDAKKTLVPGSDVKIKRTDPEQIRRQWDRARQAVLEGTIVDWKVIGPFMTKTPGNMPLDTPTPLEQDFLARGDGTVDLAAAYKDHGKTLKWFGAKARLHDGELDCNDVFGNYEFCMVYGYASVRSSRNRNVVLNMGSDDGIKVWLNGKQVHRLEAMRGYSPRQRPGQARLNKGVNHFVVKLVQLGGSWGFGVSIVDA